MSNSPIIRKMQIEDFQQVVALYRELVGDSKVASDLSGRKQWQQVLSHPGTVVFGLEKDHQLCAMTTLHVLPNMTYGGRPYGLIENVVTLGAEQGKGLGRRLMEHVIAQAWDQNCYKIMLLTGKMAGARGFYERLGFSDDEKFGMTLRRIPTRN
ncbi:MAG: GNAT family N-acetyltransferase [Rhizobiaceae bacterium]|nr:GNAT family N-acetyltransferase [Rhizobiaceae bacterium]